MELKVTRKSFRYQSELVWSGERRGTASVNGKPDVAMSSPPEFKGDATRWSPEDMFVASLNACLLMTFLAYAQREELELVSYQSSGEGLLEFSEGKYRFTEVVLRPRLKVKAENDVDLAKSLVESAHRDCIISNSVSAVVKIEPEIAL